MSRPKQNLVILSANRPSGGILYGLNGQTINGNSSGAWAIAANGTNQNITLTPSGTGRVVLGAVGSATGAPSTVGLLYGTGGGGQIAKASLALIRTDSALPSGRIEFRGNAGTAGAGWAIKTDSSLTNSFDIAFVASGTFSEAYTFSMRSGGTSLFGGNLLLGGLTTDGTGVLQFPAATTSAGGIAMGTDLFVYRAGAGFLNIASTAAGGAGINISRSGGTASTWDLYSPSGGSTFVIGNGSGAVITLDSSQNATFAANVINSTSTKTGAGALAVTTTTSKYTTAGVADALTLADGVNGQLKEIILDVLTTGGDTAVLTPATKTGYSTITFSAAGQSATLRFVTTRGWIIMSLRGAVAA